MRQVPRGLANGIEMRVSTSGVCRKESFVWGGDTEVNHKKEVRTCYVAKGRWKEGPSSREGSLNDSWRGCD